MTSFPVLVCLGQVKETGAPAVGKSKKSKSEKKFYSDEEEEEEEEEEGSSSEDNSSSSSSSSEGLTWVLLDNFLCGNNLG